MRQSVGRWESRFFCHVGEGVKRVNYDAQPLNPADRPPPSLPSSGPPTFLLSPISLPTSLTPILTPHPPTTYSPPYLFRPANLPPSQLDDVKIKNAIVAPGCVISKSDITHSIIGSRSIIGERREGKGGRFRVCGGDTDRGSGGGGRGDLIS